MLSPVLQSLQQIGHLSEQELSLVQNKLGLRSIKKNSFIVQEGNLCQAFYFLNKGSCSHTFTTPEGIEVILNLYVENDWLSDYQSFTSQKPSKNNIRAFEDCELVELTVHAFHELIGLSPSFFRIGRLFEKLQNPETLWNIKSHDEMYKELLAKRPQLIQRFPLKYVASYLRMAPETLSRIRKRLK
jgi:CRP-like cAMP-binding protein